MPDDDLQRRIQIGDALRLLAELGRRYSRTKKGPALGPSCERTPWGRHARQVAGKAPGDPGAFVTSRVRAAGSRCRTLDRPRDRLRLCPSLRTLLPPLAAGLWSSSG